MNWVSQLINDVDSVPHALLVLSVCATIGAAIGNIKIRGVQLGAAGVLFAGLILGHFGITLNHFVLDFVRDLGLALFVYMVGLSVGPGFFSSLKRNGLKLNSLAASVVILGALTTVFLAYVGGIDIAAAAGLFCGATTNTPALGAVTQLLGDTLGTQADKVKLPGLGYAVSYPLGVLGIIGSLLTLKIITRSNIAQEAERFEQDDKVPALKGLSVRVENPNLMSVPIEEVAQLLGGKVTLARVQHDGKISPVKLGMNLHVGDVVHAVGTDEGLRQLQILVGSEAGRHLNEIQSDVVMRTVVVTNKKVLDRPLAEIELNSAYGVNVTRLTRGEVELLASPGLRLRFGDVVRVVGEKSVMTEVETLLGNSKKKLLTPDLLPVFLGLAVGIVLGTIPIPIPGFSVPLKLGMAAGPLIVALIISRVGQIGGIISYFPSSANAGLREFGILLFIACVGLKAGGSFMATLLLGDGLNWMFYGVIITVAPLLIVGLFARLVLKMNLLTIWGVCAGSTTDPPALAFASNAAPSNAAAIAYATVYPVVMLMRVITAQLIVLISM